MGTVRLRHASKPRLSSHYSGIAGIAVAPRIELQIIPAGAVRKYPAMPGSLVLQINGIYQAGFYDACALMCRRLLETPCCCWHSKEREKAKS